MRFIDTTGFLLTFISIASRPLIVTNALADIAMHRRRRPDYSASEYLTAGRRRLWRAALTAFFIAADQHSSTRRHVHHRRRLLLVAHYVETGVFYTLLPGRGGLCRRRDSAFWKLMQNSFTLWLSLFRFFITRFTSRVR